MERYAYVGIYLHICKFTQVCKSVRVNGFTQYAKFAPYPICLLLHLVETKCSLHICKFYLCANLIMWMEMKFAYMSIYSIVILLWIDVV